MADPFAVKGSVEHQERFSGILNSLAKKYGHNCIGKVWFDCPYAARVHEDLEMPHRVGGPKFLTRAIIATHQVVKMTLVTMLTAGKQKLKDAIQACMNLIKADAQTKCPVQTGRLKASARADVIETTGGVGINNPPIGGKR